MAVALALLTCYVVFVAVLWLVGKREDARAVAGFVPDCVVLFKRLVADRRIPRRRKVPLLLMLVYLAMPFDLVPDFIPVVGQLDDAVLVTYVLRRLLRDGGAALVEEHWPGPGASLIVILRLAGCPRTRAR